MATECTPEDLANAQEFLQKRTKAPPGKTREAVDAQIDEALTRNKGPHETFKLVDVAPFESKIQKAKEAADRAKTAVDEAPRGQKGKRQKKLLEAKVEQRNAVKDLRLANETNLRVKSAWTQMAKRVTKTAKDARIQAKKVGRQSGVRRDKARAKALASEGRARVNEEQPDLVQRLVDAFRSAGKSRELTEAEVALGRKRQSAKVRAAGAKGGTLQERVSRGRTAQRGKLRPESAKGTPVDISDADSKKLGDALDKYYRVDLGREQEGLNAQAALLDILNGDYGQLTKSEMDLLERALGYDFHVALTARIASDLNINQEVIFGALTLWNLPRRFLAGLADWSFMLRQNLFMAITETGLWAKVAKEYPKAFFSADYAAEAAERLMDKPQFRTFREWTLAMPTSGIDIQGEELLLTGAEKGWLARQVRSIPLLGDMFDATDRSAAVYISSARAELAEKWIVQDIMTPDFRAKYLDAVDDEAKDLVLREWIAGGNDGGMRNLMAFVNETTGRGTLGPLDKYAQPLNFIFFAPRFVAGQVTRARFAVDPRISKPVKQLAVKKLLRFYGTLGTVLGVIGASGAADVEWNPLSTDFAKVRLKGTNTRIDITGGLQPLIRYTAQIASGKRKPEVGDIQDLDIKGSVLNLVRSKMAPSSGVIWTALAGENFIGEESGLKTFTVDLFAPIFLQDIGEAVGSGNPLSTLASLLAFPGIGVQTYQSTSIAAQEIVDDMFEEGLIDPERYPDGIPEWADLLPEDQDEFQKLAPNITEELRKRTGRSIEKIGEGGQQAILGELGRIGREQTREGVETAARVFEETRNGSDFRDSVDAAVLRQRGLRSGMEELREGLSLEERERLGPVFENLTRYFDIFDRYPDADFDRQQKIDMFEEIEQFFGTLSAKDEAAVEDQLGLNLEEVPLYAELKADRKTIRESGWFDLGEDVWNEMRSLRPDLNLPATRREYEISLGQEARQRFPGDPLQQDRFEDRDRTLKSYQSRKDRANQRFYRANGAILVLLDRWGYRDFAKGDRSNPGIREAIESPSTPSTAGPTSGGFPTREDIISRLR